MDPSNPWIFPVFFVALWLGVSFLIAQIGGWAELSRYYRAASPFVGMVWHFQSCRMRLTMRYNGCLNIGADQEGLSLSTIFLFRFAHPPLCIPWREMSAKTGRLLWWYWMELRFRQAPSVWIRFYGQTCDQIKDGAGSSFPPPEQVF